MSILHLFHKVHHKWIKLTRQPIRILAFHHVADNYDPRIMWQCDYTNTTQFIRNITSFINAGYTFIPLTEAHRHLQKRTFRRQKYAVLTADDGYKTLFNILPWLYSRNIPITLFINSQYLDEHHWSKNNEIQALSTNDTINMNELCKELYLSYAELQKLSKESNGLLTIGLHGHEHLLCSEISDSELKENANQCITELKKFENCIPYYAYPCDSYNENTHNILLALGLTPVTISGRMNYNNKNVIERECIDGCTISTIDILGPVRYQPSQL